MSMELDLQGERVLVTAGTKGPGGNLVLDAVHEPTPSSRRIEGLPKPLMKWRNQGLLRDDLPLLPHVASLAVGEPPESGVPTAWCANWAKVLVGEHLRIQVIL